MADFENDQYFFLEKRDFDSPLSKIRDILERDQSNQLAYERVWVPEKQVIGETKKIGEETFRKIENIFDDAIVGEIEEKTGLNDLELVAIRQNTVGPGGLVSSHTDVEGYVLMVDLDASQEPFEGGDFVFTKDDGEIVQIPSNFEQVLVAKCTNEHGVTRVTKGERSSIALFARPRLKK